MSTDMQMAEMEESDYEIVDEIEENANAKDFPLIVDEETGEVLDSAEAPF